MSSNNRERFDWKGEHFQLLKELAIKMTDLLMAMVDGNQVSPTVELHNYLEDIVKKRNLNVNVAQNVVPGLMHHTDGQFTKFGFDARVSTWKAKEQNVALEKLNFLKSYFLENWDYDTGRKNTVNVKLKLKSIDSDNLSSTSMSDDGIRNYNKEKLKDIELVTKFTNSVILTGVPGTGKTYFAKQYAKSKISNDNEMLVVQFHPSYSYQEFIEGYFPDKESKEMKLSLRKGSLKQFLESNKNTSSPLFLIIDEINRGNIQEIFGELMYAIEYRNESVSTLYSNGGLTIPANLFIIGTMNSSDKSIASMDFALRRRFYFVEIEPDFDLLFNWLIDNEIDNNLAESIRSHMLELNDKIKSSELGHDYQIGHSFLMKKGINLEHVYSIWKFQFIPMIVEMCHGNKRKAIDILKQTKLLSNLQSVEDLEYDPFRKSFLSIED